MLITAFLIHPKLMHYMFTVISSYILLHIILQAIFVEIVLSYFCYVLGVFLREKHIDYHNTVYSIMCIYESYTRRVVLSIIVLFTLSSSFCLSFAWSLYHIQLKASIVIGMYHWHEHRLCLTSESYILTSVLYVQSM